MPMVHLRVICPQPLVPTIVDVLTHGTGVIGITSATLGDAAPGESVVHAELARESADGVLAELRDHGVLAQAMVALDPIDTAMGVLAERAEADAPGEGADALLWDELAARTGEDSKITLTFLAFMVLATLLAGIGVVTDSTVTVVGACVIGPEFGPLAGLAVGLVRRRGAVARRAAAALVIGFPAAIGITALFTLVAHAAGLVDVSALAGDRQTEFIYHPGWFSLIAAFVAGTTGMLSLTSSKSAALVGVFISVTTIPAAGNASVAAVLGHWYESGQSLLQLGINIVGIVVAATITLALRGATEINTRARDA
jgi:uncharacterized hydrophobic protein (TIGR00271 family)